MIGIYKITSPSDRIYIGQSIDINKRFRKYYNLKCKQQPKLYNSLCKYGVDAHIVFDMMMATHFDTCMDTDVAESILERFMNK